jgi:hypothetical protein
MVDLPLYFPVRIDIDFKGTFAANENLQGRERVILFQIGQFT